jgi:hypothetical protein
MLPCMIHLTPQVLDPQSDVPAPFPASQLRWGGRPLTALMCHSGGVENTTEEASMGEVSTVGIDLAKSVFQVHGSDPTGAVIFRKKLRRDQVLSFFSTLPRCVVAMEACASAHY